MFKNMKVLDLNHARLEFTSPVQISVTTLTFIDDWPVVDLEAFHCIKG